MTNPSLNHGLVRIPEYQALLTSALFLEMEQFSDRFVAMNASNLHHYKNRWVSDPLHQWSRQWEYPFVFAELAKFLGNGTHKRIDVLDAGSGITFFPYYLADKFDNLSVQCVDQDVSLAAQYDIVNKAFGSQVEFRASGIDKIALPDESFDVIYCISVLEHTKNYAEIIGEFTRLLRPRGRLILTFDISIDGNADIPIPKAGELLTTLGRKLRAIDEPSITTVKNYALYSGNDIVTTQFIKSYRPSSLPWKYPRLSGALASLANGKFPTLAMKNLTFSCHVFEKSAGERDRRDR